MNPSGSEFTLRVAICDLVERLKRMQHKCSYLEECRNQLVKEVIRLRIQNEWLAKQMHDTPAGNVPSGGGLPASSLSHANPNSATPPGEAQTAGQCFCNVGASVSGTVPQMSKQHHHPSLVNSSSSPNPLQHQPNCPFANAVGNDSSAAAAAAAATAALLTGDTSSLAAAYFVNGDNPEHLNISPTSASQRQNSAGSAAVANNNNNTVSDESLHLMNILNQFEQEDNNASKENSIKNLTLQMLKELENEMRTGKLKSDLLKLVNSGQTKKSLTNPDELLHFDVTTGNNNNSGDKSLESLEDSGAFDRSKGKSDTVPTWNSTKSENNSTLNGSRSALEHNLSAKNDEDFLDLTELLNEDELISLVSLIRREIKTLQQNVHSSTERLSKIKQKNEDDKFRYYFQKQIKSEPATNQSINQPNTGGQTSTGSGVSVSLTSATGNAQNSSGNLIQQDRNVSGTAFSGSTHKTNLKHS